MAKVYADELQAVLSSGTFDTFSQEISESKNLSSAISNFVDSTNSKLTGSQYDAFRSQFARFNEALSIRMSIAEKLGSAIKEAIQILLDYLGEDMFLDSSKLEEYRQARNTCAQSIETLKGMMNKTHQVERNGTMVTENVYSYSEISSKLSVAQSTLDELDRIIKKIEGLDEVYSRAEAILKGAFSELDSFKSNVSGITPNGVYSYQIA